MVEEIYGDVLFIINFSMDFLALFLVGMILIFMNQNERKQVTQLFPFGLWMFT